MTAPVHARLPACFRLPSFGGLPAHDSLALAWLHIRLQCAHLRVPAGWLEVFGTASCKHRQPLTASTS
jgi:hypothetical protein